MGSFPEFIGIVASKMFHLKDRHYKQKGGHFKFSLCTIFSNTAIEQSPNLSVNTSSGSLPLEADCTKLRDRVHILILIFQKLQ